MLTPKTRLGTYEILGPLGAGGMGEVYLAKDLRLGREVAVKVLPEAVGSSPDRLARFEREARTVAGLNHPNIVTLHSVEDEGGVRFLTMELVEGQTLSDLVTPGGLPLPRILELSIPMCDALIAAHERGVIHRDLKPGNVMVTREGRVKVLDFGLAKWVHSDASADPDRAATASAPLSRTGEVVGTVPYMAPEQLLGKPADAGSDLFALGAILYELATGMRPFSGATHAETASAILRDEPAPVTRLRPDLPPEIDAFMARILKKRPADRYQSATDVRDALRKLQLAVLQAAPAGAAEGPSIAVLPFSNMSADPENEYFSDGLSEELLNALVKIPDLKVTGRTSSFAFKGKNEDMRQIGQKLGVRNLLEGSVRKVGNRVRIVAQLVNVADGFHLWSETYDRVLDDIFAVQDDIARSVSTALHVTLLGKPISQKPSAASYELALRANHLFQLNSREAIAGAVSLYRKAIAESANYAPAWSGLARAHAFETGYGYADYDVSHRAARAAAERALALDDTLADGHEVMASILGYIEFRWKDAMESIHRARSLAPGASGPMVTMSVYEVCLGRMEEALRLARLAQEIDPLNPVVHMNGAGFEDWASNTKSACQAFERALELSPAMTATRTNVGLAYLRLGMEDKGIAEIQKEAVQGYREWGLTIAYHMLGRRQESDEALARLLAQSENWAYQFASAHACRENFDEAFRWLERACELHDTGIVSARVTWTLRGLHSDPRWPGFLDRTGLGGVS